jgi:hypothetical protein
LAKQAHHHHARLRRAPTAQVGQTGSSSSCASEKGAHSPSWPNRLIIIIVVASLCPSTHTDARPTRRLLQEDNKKIHVGVKLVNIGVKLPKNVGFFLFSEHRIVEFATVYSLLLTKQIIHLGMARAM